MAYDNTNRGSIWGNKKKRPGKQDADFTGSLNVNGVEFYYDFGDGKWQVLTETDKEAWRCFLKEERPEWMGDNLYPLNGLTKKQL